MQNLLNNTDTLVDVVGKMNAVVTEVAAQATQIEEIMGLLDGKSVPGGSGSGGSVETCEVTVYSADSPIGPELTTYYVDGTLSLSTHTHSADIGSGYDVAKGSIFITVGLNSSAISGAGNVSLICSSSTTCVWFVSGDCAFSR